MIHSGGLLMQRQVSIRAARVSGDSEDDHSALEQEVSIRAARVSGDSNYYSERHEYLSFQSAPLG